MKKQHDVLENSLRSRFSKTAPRKGGRKKEKEKKNEKNL